jgi:phospholipid transport system substrate-binding protein
MIGHEVYMKKIAALLVSVAFALAVGVAGAQDLAPDALVRKTTDEIIGSIHKDKELVANSRKLLDLVDAKVLPHFNFTRMTMLAVGRPWRDATPAQREQLVKQFRTLLVRTYSTAIEQYSNQTIDVRPLTSKPTDTEATVRTQIIQPGGPPIPMDYRMEKTAQGWKVFDVTVEGVSIVTTYRSTFATEVTKGGIDGLIKTISDQNTKLEKRTAEKT